MFFHVILTTECNLRCSYCHGEVMNDFTNELNTPVEFNLPTEISYPVEDLSKFCEKDPESSLIFYGGEPLLRLEKMYEIMNMVPAKRFLIQTNGTYLHRVDPRYLRKLHTIAVSIDGREETTNSFRGEGTFRKVIENLKLARSRGFNGEIIARMTVMEPVDIYEEVTWLLNNEEFSFPAVHWQLNAGFWNDYERRNFKRWVKESYNPGIRKLVKFWIQKMEEKGKVLKLYPFVGIVKSLLERKPSALRCGAGWANYAIQTDGQITPCPSMWGTREFYLGNIKNSDPTRLPKIFVGERCHSCEIYSLCGGRCLYANVFQRWRPEDYLQVCNATKNLIDSLKQEVPKIKELIDRKTIAERDFEFLEFNGCEIIP